MKIIYDYPKEETIESIKEEFKKYKEDKTAPYKEMVQQIVREELLSIKNSISALTSDAVGKNQFILEILRNSEHNSKSIERDICRLEVTISAKIVEIHKELDAMRQALKQIPETMGKIKVEHNKFISDCDLSSRTKNCLKNNNILTIQDLAATTKQELRRFPNLGQISLREIQDFLTKLGFELS